MIRTTPWIHVRSPAVAAPPKDVAAAQSLAASLTTPGSSRVSGLALQARSDGRDGRDGRWEIPFNGG